MNNFTILSIHEILGMQQLEIIKKYGTKAPITDFSILLGARYYGGGNSTLADRSGCYWTKTGHYNGSGVEIVNDRGEQSWELYDNRYVGVRPAVTLSSILGEKEINGIEVAEVEYGEYPQTVVPEELSTVLEHEYNNGMLKKSGKEYTTDSPEDIYHKGIKERKHIEYEYKGKKYIRIVADASCKNQILSDGREIESGRAYWISVEPITWLVDRDADIALSKRILISGIQLWVSKSHSYYDSGDFYVTDMFEQSLMNNFLNKYFANEIRTSMPHSQITPEEEINAIIDTIINAKCFSKETKKKLIEIIASEVSIQDDIETEITAKKH